MDPDVWQGGHSTAMRLTDEPSGGPLPVESGQTMAATAAEIGGERLNKDGDHPTVDSDAWLKHDDYWQRMTYIAVTGRQTAQRPPTRPLPRPHRFRQPSPLRSAVILLLTLALIVLIPLGVVVAQYEAAAHIKLPTSMPNIPGLTRPTAAPTHAPTVTPAKPTATPKKK